MLAANRLESLRRVYGVFPRPARVFCGVCRDSWRHRDPVLGLHGEDVERAAPGEEKVQLQHGDADARRDCRVLCCCCLLRRGKHNNNDTI